MNRSWDIKIQHAIVPIETLHFQPRSGSSIENINLPSYIAPSSAATVIIAFAF